MPNEKKARIAATLNMTHAMAAKLAHPSDHILI